MTRPSSPPEEFHFRPEFNHQIREEDFVKALVQITDAYSKTRAYRRAKKRQEKKRLQSPAHRQPHLNHSRKETPHENPLV
ncbi:hypothetical protein [Corynebacterium cystitidis]|uniref:hypothetical protein n=1 Tax=Corynebacterium cystitidis TaxID=35757 RepID=UPI00211E655D|nr:hypothetical protein [Corynebacterium cystitidis]